MARGDDFGADERAWFTCCICAAKFNARNFHPYKFTEGVCSWECHKRKEWRGISMNVLHKAIEGEREDAFIEKERKANPYMFT